jgi:hypothetical protein
MSTMLREALERVDGPARAEVVAAARERFEPFRVGAGYAVPGVSLVASAR